jgi:hypothetical protein
MKLEKEFRKFSDKKIMVLRVLSSPSRFENTMFLMAACEDKSVRIYKIEKKVFSIFSGKLVREVKEATALFSYPITQITELPSAFKEGLETDPVYKDSSLVCVAAVNTVLILKVSYSKL